MKIIIPGDPRTKKNSQRVIKNPRNGRLIIAPSTAYRDYEKVAGAAIPRGQRIRIDYPVNIKCLYYMQTRRRVDLTNLLEATDDILVLCGVLADDNCRIVAAHDGSRVLHDKHDPRVEIYIAPIAACEKVKRNED
ncbi:MAG TPA: hypothetical protein DDX59_06635 [Lachnospiraceae bacterium]|nr:hypothetical protein [Lachnospiraceae bacterium]